MILGERVGGQREERALLRVTEVGVSEFRTFDPRSRFELMLDGYSKYFRTEKRIQETSHMEIFSRYLEFSTAQVGGTKRAAKMW